MAHLRFSRMILFAALAASLILPASAAARERFGIGVGYYGGYGGYYGGPFYPYGYGGYGYGPYAGYGYGGYGYGGYGRPMGEVHIKSPDAKAQIYINGAFAGRAHELKTLYLAPGTYNIEQRIGTDVQKERVYVLANRSLKLEFDKPGVAHTAPSVVPNGAPPDPGPRPEANPQPRPEEARPEANIAPQPAPAPQPEAQRQ